MKSMIPLDFWFAPVMLCHNRWAATRQVPAVLTLHDNAHKCAKCTIDKTKGTKCTECVYEQTPRAQLQGGQHPYPSPCPEYSSHITNMSQSTVAALNGGDAED